MKTLVILNQVLTPKQISNLGGERVNISQERKKELWVNLSDFDQVVCQGELSVFKSENTSDNLTPINIYPSLPQGCPKCGGEMHRSSSMNSCIEENCNYWEE